MSARHNHISGLPVVEGVRIEFGSASACAVRTRNRDIAVYVRQQSRYYGRTFRGVPLLRGVARLFGSVARMLGGLRQSARMRPRAGVRGSTSQRRFAELFRTRPLSIAAFLNAIAMVLITAAMMVAMPMLAQTLLLMIDGLPRFAINIVGCLFRLLGLVLSVYMIARLRVISRLCMHRGAVGKVINAYEAYGDSLTVDEAAQSSYLTNVSDGAFLLTTAGVAIVFFALVPPWIGSWMPLARFALLLAAAAVTNEVMRPLERAKPDGFGATLRKPFCEMQNIFTLPPDRSMLEVAVCAFQAAYDNDLNRQRGRQDEGAPKDDAEAPDAENPPETPAESADGAEEQERTL